MSWVSVQEDIIKRFEGSLDQLRDLPNSIVLENRCKVLLQDLRERLSALDGEGHIKWRFSELNAKYKATEYDKKRYEKRNLELIAENRSLKLKITSLEKKHIRAAQRMNARFESEVKERTKGLKGEVDKLKTALTASAKQVSAQNEILTAMRSPTGK